MKTVRTILALAVCLFCSVTLAEDDVVGKDSDVFPTLVRDALLNSTSMAPKQSWICGVQHGVGLRTEHYVVMVPGNEGYPGRYERRTRSVPTHQPIPHRYKLDEVVVTNVAGKKLDQRTVEQSIAKFRSFLFLPAGKTVSDQARSIFNEEMVVITPRPCRPVSLGSPNR